MACAAFSNGYFFPHASQHRRALVVDGDARTAEAAAMLIEAEGFETYTALSAVEALGRGAQIHPNLVLLDLTTIRMDGYAVASAMRATDWGKAATFIAVTADSAPTTRDRCIDAGFDHYVVKPTDYRELARSLRMHD